MFKQKIFISSFIVLIIVAVSNYIGIKYNLYWVYKWYDIPMHILGGLWVSLFFLSFYLFFKKDLNHNIFQKETFFKVLLILLFITISWEIFELVSKTTFLSDGIYYWIDTIKDILDGFIGGIAGYFLYLKLAKN